MSLVELLNAASVSPSGLTVEIPEAWTQGRTGYGGVTAALCLAAAQHFSQDRPLRSAQISFVGPSAGPVRVEAEQLRVGRNAAAVRARLSGPQGIGVEAVFTFSARRDSVLDQPGRAAPASPPAPGEAPLGFPDGAPAFTRRLEFVWRSDTAPFFGCDRAYELSWVRHRDPASRDHPLALLCLADALPPAVSTTLAGVAPLSSMTWMIDFHDDAPRTADGWWLLEARADFAAGGHSSQDMSIWNTDGGLVARGRQMVTVFA